jgi:hypothetical protein
MKKNNVVELKGRDALTDPVSELLVSGARQLIMQAIEAELQGFMKQYSEQQTEDGKAVVVRNGYLPERELQTALGPVTIKMPKVRSRTGEPITFGVKGDGGIKKKVV